MKMELSHSVLVIAALFIFLLISACSSNSPTESQINTAIANLLITEVSRDCYGKPRIMRMGNKDQMHVTYEGKVNFLVKTSAYVTCGPKRGSYDGTLFITNTNAGWRASKFLSAS
jgi:ABC-type Fe3+-hydroxamate transport system substrate-binding protein